MVECPERELEVYRPRPGSAAWKVPALCNNDWIALSLTDMCLDLGFRRPFDLAFGAPQCAWQGGRPAVMRQELSELQLMERFEAYAARGIRPALTLSRLAVEGADYGNAYGNRLLGCLARVRGQAIVTDEGLARYIRDRYPEVGLVASFDRALVDAAPGMPDAEDETAYYRRTLSLFDEVVVRCEYALADRLIGQMGEDERARTEVIVNQVCVAGCTRGYEHVHAIEQFNEGTVAGPCQECFHVAVTADVRARLATSVLVTNRRIDELARLGVGTFKIGGRNAPIPKFLDLLGTYIFEPSGAFVPMRVALSRRLAEHIARHPHFAPFDLP